AIEKSSDAHGVVDGSQNGFNTVWVDQSPVLQVCVCVSHEDEDDEAVDKFLNIAGGIGRQPVQHPQDRRIVLEDALPVFFLRRIVQHLHELFHMHAAAVG